MLYLIIVLFAIAAVFGILILMKWVSKTNASKIVVYSHGIIAALGLILLVIYVLQNPVDIPKVSVVLFLLAAIGGFYLFFVNLLKNKFPLRIALFHALLAVAGFIVLLFFVFV